MKRLFLISVIFVSIAVLGGISDGVTYGASFSPEKQTKKFLTAIQKKDFKTVFNITYYYQAELSKIKDNNPKVLWQKLTSEYYESKKNALFKERKESLTNAWIRFGGELFGSRTDPAKNIQTLMNLLTPSSKWKVIESKKKKQYDSWSGRQFDVFVVYVSLNYKTVEVSPLITDFYRL